MSGGMVIGILNAIGSQIILRLIPYIGFHNRVVKIQVTSLSLVVLLYTNIALITLADKTHLSYRWFQNYGTAIYTGLIMSNMFFYLKPLIQICMVKKCKKIVDRGDFVLERRYALMINTVFVIFTFGFYMPTLFIVGAANFVSIYFLDKLLITYWCDNAPIHSDSLHFFSLNVLKYAPVLLMAFAGASVHFNYCLVNRDKIVPKYFLN